MPLKILVIGGTLFIGRLLVAELLKGGHEISVLHRGPTHDLGSQIHNLQGDRNDPTSLRLAFQGRNFDAVFDNVYDWERGTTAAQVEATADALLETGSRLFRYVFISSVAVYGEGLDHLEDDPLAPDSHPDPYVRNKAMTERALFRRYRESGFPVVTFRPPFVYGPANPFYRETFFWDRMRAGRPVIVPGDGSRLMQFVFVKDLVAAMVSCLDTAGAVGQAFNIGNDRAVPQVELIHLLATAAGVQPRVVRVPRDKIVERGGNPMGSPAYFGEYFDLPSITEKMGKAERILGVAATPFDSGLAETYRWYANLRSETAVRAKLDTSGTDTSVLDTRFEDELISEFGGLTG